jgi:hypothetical protein
MKKLLPGIFALVLTSNALFAQTPNTLTPKEEKAGWVLLFDGKTLNGWHTYNKAEAGSSWGAVDGALQFTPGNDGRGDITTDKAYENYELSMDWKISEGGNSGIIFDVQEDPKYGASYLTGAEMQVLDNVKAEDNKKDNHLAGSLYDMIPASKAANPAGEWNTVKILQNKGKLTFWLNGAKVVNTTIGSPEWQQILETSKFKGWNDFMKVAKGKIALQDHGHQVAYRNIKIKQL